MDTVGKRFHVNFLGYAYWFMSTSISQIKNHYISVYQDRYATSLVSKYLYTAAVKTSTKFYKTSFLSNTIFTKDDASTSYEQFEKSNREFNTHYRASIGSSIELLPARVYLSFVVHKLRKFSSNPDKVNFEGLVHLLICIKDDNNLVLNHFAGMKDAPLSDLLKQANIKT